MWKQAFDKMMGQSDKQIERYKQQEQRMDQKFDQDVENMNKRSYKAFNLMEESQNRELDTMGDIMKAKMPSGDEKILDARKQVVEQNESDTCLRCNDHFTLFNRRHHCRFCGKLYCNTCCHVLASFPIWFGYTTPQRVCEECIPSLFHHRQKKVQEGEKETNIKVVHPNLSLEGSEFHATGEQLSIPFLILPPFCKIAFWVCGMYKGGSFNRRLINAAAAINLPFASEPVTVTKKFIPVPKQWPPYNGEEMWNTYSVTDLPTTEVTDIPVSIFTPDNATDPLPVLIWYHGGGFCIASAAYMVQTICCSFAHRTGCIVVSVEYRLAPEYKFPTQVEDAYCALKWVYSNAKTFGGDPNRIAVGGDSAGGSLSAVVSILARDRQFQGSICHQLLVYPCVTNPLTDDIESHVRYAQGPILSKDICAWFMTQVFDDMEKGLRHPFASPLHLESHHGLPPATIINALHDPLCDHGSLYAKKLRGSGVPTTRTVYSKSLHGFFGSNIGESKEAVAEAAAALKHAFLKAAVREQPKMSVNK